MRLISVVTAAVALVILTSSGVYSQEEAQPPEGVPPLEEVQEGAEYIYDPETGYYIPVPGQEEYDFVPMDFDFRVAIIGEVEHEIPASGAKEIKTPLVLIDPRNADRQLYAQNFPARIVTSSPNGAWVVGVAPSSAVEGSSGSRQRECAVSLNMNEGEIDIIEEFPLFSEFQAFFAPKDNNIIYYSVNEPAAVNQIISHNLKNDETTPLPVEGNRFYLHGLRPQPPTALWISDPFSLKQYPVLNLLDIETAESLAHVEFPGATDVTVQPGGEAILAIISNSAEASIGYYLNSDSSFHQVQALVLTRPTFRWAHHSLAVIAKESTATRDRFLWINLQTGDARELCSGHFKITLWDISPNDDALVFVAGTGRDPLLYIVPLDPNAEAVNRIRLKGVSDVSWIGCLQPPSGGGGWLQRLLPF